MASVARGAAAAAPGRRMRAFSRRMRMKHVARASGFRFEGDARGRADGGVGRWRDEGAGAVDVWCHDARGRSEGEARARASGWTTASESRELDASTARLVARAFVRKVLASYDPSVSAREIEFALGERGKPRVATPESSVGRRFSVSHCDGLIAVCVSEGGDVGVDVEDENRRVGSDVMRFARRWLSAREVENLLGVADADERARAFMRLWTAKEAYVKALGLGIAGRPFREFDVDFQRASEEAVTSVELRDGAAGNAWRVALFRPRPERSHVLALCAPATPSGSFPLVRARWASIFDDDVAEADFALLAQSRRRAE